MSATLEGAAVSRLLGEAPVVTANGRVFPVTTRYAGKGMPPLPEMGAGRGTQESPEALTARIVRLALEEEPRGRARVSSGSAGRFIGCGRCSRALPRYRAARGGCSCCRSMGSCRVRSRTRRSRLGAPGISPRRARDQHRGDEPDHSGGEGGSGLGARAPLALRSGNRHGAASRRSASRGLRRSRDRGERAGWSRGCAIGPGARARSAASHRSARRRSSRPI